MAGLKVSQTGHAWKSPLYTKAQQTRPEASGTVASLTGSKAEAEAEGGSRSLCLGAQGSLTRQVCHLLLWLAHSLAR